MTYKETRNPIILHCLEKDRFFDLTNKNDEMTQAYESDTEKKVVPFEASGNRKDFRPSVARSVKAEIAATKAKREAQSNLQNANNNKSSKAI